MKKTGRIFFVILLATALVVCALPVTAGADSTGVCFTAVDDNILDLSLMPIFVGGSPYVPWTVFGSLGVSTSYFDSVNTAMLFVGSNQIMFDLNEGTCYDANGMLYPLSAVSRYGNIYVPAWTGSIFGLSYSYISGIGNGDVVRIKSGSQVLTDSGFIDAAATKMKSMYNAYYGTPEPATTPAEPQDSDKPESDGGSVMLSFAGLPDARLLDTLKNYGVRCCFFLTAEQAQEDGDILRRTFGEGHSLGVYFTTGEELEEGARAIQRAVFMRPTLATGPEDEDALNAARDNGFALYLPEKTVDSKLSDPSVISLSLPTDGTGCNMLIACGENTVKLIGSVLGYMATNKYTPVCLKETDIYQ